MKKLIPIVFIACLMTACASQKTPQAVEGPKLAANASFVVKVINHTFFDIEILTESRVIPHGDEREISLPVQSNIVTEGYQISYRVKLAEGVIKTIPGDHIIIKPGQDRVVIEIPQFSYNESYVTVLNNSSQPIRVRRTNSSIYRNNIEETRAEFPTGSRNVYLADLISSSIATAQDELFPIPLDHVSPGFIYEFVFDGANVSLTDARPLHRIGEQGWAKTVADANYPPALVQGGDGQAITFLAAGENGATLYSLPQNSTAWEAHTRQDISTDTTVLMRTKDERLLLVGYQYNGDTYIPFVQKQSVDGKVQWQAPASTRQDSRSAYLLAAAEKGDDTWLVAGGADTGVNSSDAYRAYIREIRDTGVGVESVWELGPGDFDSRCGAVECAVYDTQYKVWRVAGKLLPNARNIQGAYICTVADGKILSTDMNFEHFSFYKICADNNGYYLIGEEQKPNGEVYAVALYYDAAGKRVWQQTSQLKSYSYYQDALVDSENKQLVLAGTMSAGNDMGKGGTPFIQGINPENGTQLWLQELNDPAFRNAALVYQMIKAPDYGYILSLTGMADDFYDKPFVVARVNARGRLISHL
jgi:hypothetical protein